MGLRKALLTATMGAALPLAAATAPAQAQPVTGLYIAGGAGVNLLQSTDVDGPGGRLGEIDWQAGVAGVLSLGWGFGNGLRAEVEGGYRWNHIDKAGIAPGLAAPFSGALVQFRGSQRTVSVMANVLYDFALFGNMPVVPYVGAGVGWAWIETHKLRATSNAFGLRFESDDWDNRFAYQAIAGLSFNLPVPGLALTTEYRFFGTLSPSHGGQVRAINAPGRPVVASGAFDTDNFNHSIMLGVRYNFGQRPPPPAPAPAPAVAPAPRTFLVFFDWDRA
ncbi:outer membrane protein, partial [Caldovatus sediminis]|uniref:outer membrane protein n=1 Tax=Caldovatus sediminis TaxID=2041189 RepID=UPI0016663036